MRKHLLWLVLFISLLMTPVPGRMVRAQEDVSYIRYDTHIFLDEDGSLTVMEIQQLQFNGQFHTGFAEIPLDYVSGIEEIAVSGGPDLANLELYQLNGRDPNSYTVARERDVIYVDWEFPETGPGESLTFVLQYKVLGALWVYPETDTLEWRAVPAERGLPVPASRVIVNLPFAVAAAALDYTAFGPAFTVETTETEAGQQIVFDAAGPIPDGVAFQVLVDFSHGLVTAEPQPWQIAEDTADLTYSLDSVDVEMVLAEDGRLHITERQQVTVQTGVMYGGFRDISLLYLDGVNDVSLAEGEQAFTLIPDDEPLCDYCAQITTSRRSGWVRYNERLDQVELHENWAGQVGVAWQFPALVKGETTTFRLGYTVDGAVSVNDDNQRFNWTIIPGYDTAVAETNVRLQLPGGMGLEEAQIEGGTAVRMAADGVILITPERPIGSGEEWQISITLPPGATTAVKPGWQSDMEAAYAAAEAARVLQAQQELMLLVVKIVVAVLLLLGLLVGWYVWGSRKAREIMGDYRTLPPSDLPPGVVAYLVDKAATARGALASLLHLANLGLIRINLGETLTLRRIREEIVSAGYEAMTPTGERVKIPAHSAKLFNALRPVLPPGKDVPLSQTASAFQAVLPEMYAAMGEEMVGHFYGDGRQTERDQLVKALPVIGFAGSFIFMLFLFGSRRSGSFGGFRGPNPFVMIAGFFGPFILGIVLQNLLRRPRLSLSKLGVKEANRWRGFKAYLQDIQQYGSLEEAQEILERYFSYAVALGVDERFAAQAKALGGRAPGWISGGLTDDGHTWQNEPFQPPVMTPVHRWSRWVNQGSWLPRPPRPSAPTISAPDPRLGLEKLSGRLTESLSSASQRMTTMLNTAVGAVDDGKPVNVVLYVGGRRVEMAWQPGASADKMLGEIMRKAEAARRPRPASGGGSGGYRGGGPGGFGGGSRSGGRSSSRSSGSRRSGGGGRRGFR